MERWRKKALKDEWRNRRWKNRRDDVIIKKNKPL